MIWIVIPTFFDVPKPRFMKECEKAIQKDACIKSEPEIIIKVKIFINEK